MRLWFWLYMAVALIPAQAVAKPLVADLSQYHIAIDSSFTGAKLILFGARQAAGDIVVVVRGPAQNFTMRKKERVGGIWVNRHSMEFTNLPDYYAVASTRPLESLLNTDVLDTLQIGVENLPYLPLSHMQSDELTFEQRQEFRREFISERYKSKLYADNQETVTFMGDTLFKTTLPFPDVTPRGGYTAETYLIYNGQIVGMQSTPLIVAKRGLDAVVFQLAHEYPAIYGIIAVLMAVSAGWLASTIFRKL
ncbi:MAG: TIGR02186 family protein [Alphaproteobacteria bacterium]|nr:TIGR02186 family protein [Alphaproteobacteria bacterium]